MKKVFVTTVLVLFAGLSSALAENQSYTNQEQQSQNVVVQPYLRSCDSPYLGNNETCVSDSNTCPGGYEFSHANYCCDHSGSFYRCGTVCKSIYAPGH